ncbi:MAG: hypothetical protein AB1411_00760 [Nitrospirota bacterium]
MARSRGSDHLPPSSRSFSSVAEVNQHIEQLHGRIAQVEELRKDGLPFREALKVAAESQIRETIRQIFGERSPEFRAHQHLRIRSTADDDLADTIETLGELIAVLEEKKNLLAAGDSQPVRPAQQSARHPTPQPAAPAAPASPPPQPQPDRGPGDASAETRQAPADVKVPAGGALERIHRLGLRFHAVARQLRQRYDGRPTLDVDDVHDVQDLLRTLLRLEFEESALEEWAPDGEDAGRKDFLVPQEGLAVTVRKTKQGLTAKALSEQLLLDFQRYAVRQGFKTLFCFVYDPEGRIGNPARLEADLRRERDGKRLDVLIAPK